MSIQSHRDLKVWQVAMDLAVEIYETTKTFPQSETYGLTSQMRRSAASVAANIAEGYGRESTKSYVQFLKTARGSLNELETHVVLAHRVQVLSEPRMQSAMPNIVAVNKMLNALIKSLQDKIPSGFAEE